MNGNEMKINNTEALDSRCAPSNTMDACYSTGSHRLLGHSQIPSKSYALLEKLQSGQEEIILHG